MAEKLMQTYDNRALMNQKRKHTLQKLVRGFPIRNVLGTMEKEITTIAFDSRRVVPGSLFVAIPGHSVDGNRYIPDAIGQGAAAFISQLPLDRLNGFGLGSNDVTAISVEDCRHALSWVSAQYYQHPSNRLNLVGITGTNGKTTLTYILETLFKLRQEKTGVIGSINYRYGDFQVPASITTPESLDINRMLDEMTAVEVRYCFLEVSSHSLALKRVHGMHISIAVFTNLSREHLDFHGTMENYKEAKKGLFRDNHIEKRVVNTDDPVGEEIIRETQAETLTTGIDRPADVMAEDCVLSEKGCRFTLKTPSGDLGIVSPLLGKHNIYNLLSAAATALLLRLPLDEIGRGMHAIDRIPGRFEHIDYGQDFTVLVDYAHTDDALRNALQAGRTIARNNLIVVFGCGGDRDRGKREEMSRVAFELGDYVVITSDNPRTEDPDRIIDDIVKGVPTIAHKDRDYSVLANRKEAIEFAVDRAQSGDVVIVAGKGHEDYQILKTGTIHFDDCEVAGSAIRRRLNLD